MSNPQPGDQIIPNDSHRAPVHDPADPAPGPSHAMDAKDRPGEDPDTSVNKAGREHAPFVPDWATAKDGTGTVTGTGAVGAALPSLTAAAHVPNVSPSGRSLAGNDLGTFLLEDHNRIGLAEAHALPLRAFRVRGDNGVTYEHVGEYKGEWTYRAM